MKDAHKLKDSFPKKKIHGQPMNETHEPYTTYTRFFLKRARLQYARNHPFPFSRLHAQGTTTYPWPPPALVAGNTLLKSTG